MIDTNFYALKVKKIQRLTDKALALIFEVPNSLSQKFEYLPGQYITLRFTLNGKEERRAYSICSAPLLQEDLTIAIKEVENGLVSKHINQFLEEGTMVEVMPPQGRFVLNTDIEAKKDYFLFASGSGITPLLSMCKSIIEEEAKSRVMLYYVNRSEKDILFKAELAKLEQRYKDQLYVHHVLTQEKSLQFEAEKGRPTPESIVKFIQKYRAEDGRSTAYYICGAEGLMQMVKTTLLQTGVEKSYIYQESFGTAVEILLQNEINNAAANAPKTVKVFLNKEEITMQLAPEETILYGLMRMQAQPPFSCMNGSCSSCMAKLISGTVHMDRCVGLEEEEVEEGYILTCTAHATSEDVVITYDI